MLSESPGFAVDPASEASGELVLAAGEYRALQQHYKDRGGRLFSVVHQQAVGGTYLIHGLSAPVRLATEDTLFYGGLPPELSRQITGKDAPAASAEDALTHGLVTEIISLQALPDRLAQILTESPP